MEQPLLPYESCSLASINLSNHVCGVVSDGNDGYASLVTSNEVDWDKLKESTHNVVLFMNRVLDKSEMPIPECQDAMEATRKIGIGIMGLHDMLIQLGLAYDSEEGRTLAEDVMRFISVECDEASIKLGRAEGCFLGDTSPRKLERRNANLTTIAPTGTLSMIADCSSGCEPYYAPVVYKTVLDGTTFCMPNKWVKGLIRTKFLNLRGEEDARCVNMVKVAMEVLEEDGTLPTDIYPILKGAEDIHWRDHILMQACLQRHVDSSISKTINMPSTTTVEEVREAYELAWKEGLKGCTVYVDGSRGAGVLSTTTGEEDSVGEATQPKQVLEGCQKAPTQDQLHAVRYRVKVKKETVYIIVSEDANGLPVEVFAKFAYAQDADWDSLCRSLSLSLRYGVPIKDVVKQLEKSVRVLNDTPSHLARILKSYIKDALVCSDCGGKVVYTEGCEKCLACGVSKCG